MHESHVAHKVDWADSSMAELHGSDLDADSATIHHMQSAHWCISDATHSVEGKLDKATGVTSHLWLVQGAIKARQPSVELMGRSIDVNCNAGIFVTMNPAGKGYGGRSKLPDNLKALFRSVAMTLPDNEIIAEVLLLSNGFASAKELGR